jgi:hypothetical protein
MEAIRANHPKGDTSIPAVTIDEAVALPEDRLPNRDYALRNVRRH